MKSRMGACAAFVAALSMLSTATTAAHAEPATVSYGRGKVAYDEGDYQVAAREFAEADEAAPNATVLELALTSALRADNMEFAMTLVERAQERGLTNLASAARNEIQSRAGRVVFLCSTGTECAATMDGDEVVFGTARWTRTGDHAVVLRANGVEERMTITVEPGVLREVRPTHVIQLVAPAATSVEPLHVDEPAQATAPSEPARSRWHPAWFWGSAAATTVGASLAVASGIDTMHIHDRFAASPRDAALADSGNSAQSRTNALLIGTVALSAATAVIAYFVFHGSPSSNKGGVARAH
jgi:hypothetical protein